MSSPQSDTSLAAIDKGMVKAQNQSDDLPDLRNALSSIDLTENVNDIDCNITVTKLNREVIVNLLEETHEIVRFLFQETTTRIKKYALQLNAMLFQVLAAIVEVEMGEDWKELEKRIYA